MWSTNNVISFCFKVSHTTTLTMLQQQQQQQQQAQQEQSAAETSTWWMKKFDDHLQRCQHSTSTPSKKDTKNKVCLNS